MSLELAFAKMCELVGADVLEGVERTRTADLSSLHVIIHALRGLPEVANPAYLVRFLCSALHRIALPVVSEWCQEQVDGASPIPLHVSLEGHSLRNGLQKPFRHGKGEVEGLVAPFLAATASSSARSLPLLC